VAVARRFIPGSSGFPVRWSGGIAIVELPAGRNFPTASALAGELSAALDAGAATGLIVDLSSSCVSDSSRLDALLRAARRARGWGSWLRLVIPEPAVRKLVRLVALDEVMPVHTSVPEAIAAAGRENVIEQPGISPGIGHQPQPVPRWRQDEATAWAG
jgi:anti-anti-sigma regulatory factor